MSAPYNNLQGKAAAALTAIISAIGATNLGGANVYISIGTESDVRLPKVLCKAEQGGEDIEGTGNYWLTLTASVVSESDPDSETGEVSADKLAQHNSRCAYVFDALKTDTIVADMTSNGTDFTCQGVRSWSFGNPYADSSTVVTDISFEALCCSSDLAT